MKRITFFVVALFCVSAFAQDLPRIGVYVTGNVGEDEKKALGTRMLASLVNSGRYKGIERSNSFLAEIEKEQVKQMSGDIDDSQISALGKQFGVKFVCIADITPAYGSFQVSARIVNVETAEVDFIGDASSPLKTMDDLTQTSNEIIRKMFREQENTPSQSLLAPELAPATAPEPKPELEPKPESNVPARKTGIRENKGISVVFGNNSVDLKSTDTEITRKHSLDPSDTIGVFTFKKKPYQQGYGISSFWGVTYGGFVVDVILGNGTWSVEEKRPSKEENSEDSIENYELDVFFGAVSLGVFWKYPVAVSDNITWFPVAGIYYGSDTHLEISFFEDNLKYEEGGRDPILLFHEALWFKFGVGLDIALGEVFFLRPEALYGIGIPIDFLWTKRMKGESNAGHGLTVRIGLGWGKKLSDKGKKKK